MPKRNSELVFIKKMTRLLDLFFSALGLITLSPIIALILILGWVDTRSPIFYQKRVGREQKTFVLLKFRTMKINTASIASHLADSNSITRIGHFLRRAKLDELPQLWNVLRGEMSLVGPRPCLPNQVKLIRERNKFGIYKVRPGITGLAQTRGIDMSTPELLAATDAEMIKTLNLKNYFKYILLTILGKGFGDRIKNKKRL